MHVCGVRIYLNGHGIEGSVAEEGFCNLHRAGNIDEDTFDKLG